MTKNKGKQKVVAVIMLLFFTVTGLAGCSSAIKTGGPSSEQGKTTITITDMAGRNVLVPKEIKKVYSAVPIGTVLLYTINPVKLAAKNFNLSELEKKYLVKEYQDLPVLGNYIVANTASDEAIVNLAPDVIMYTGVIDDTWKSKVEEAQQKLNIPVVMVDSDLKNIAAAYEFVGKLLGEEERARQLGQYCREAVSESQKITSTIPENEKRKVYYAVGKDGLMTYAQGNIHSEIIDLAGGQNISVGQGANPFSLTQMSLEELIKWNPDIIMANKVEARGGEKGTVAIRTQILENSSLNNLEAVKKHQVYEIPCAPFSWFGEPPSVARILGMKWLANLLYPDKFNYNIIQEAKEFYKTFYSYDLTDADIQELMSNALVK